MPVDTVVEVELVAAGAHMVVVGLHKAGEGLLVEVNRMQVELLVGHHTLTVLLVVVLHMVDLVARSVLHMARLGNQVVGLIVGTPDYSPVDQNSLAVAKYQVLKL